MEKQVFFFSSSLKLISKNRLVQDIALSITESRNRKNYKINGRVDFKTENFLSIFKYFIYNPATDSYKSNTQGKTFFYAIMNIVPGKGATHNKEFILIRKKYIFLPHRFECDLQNLILEFSM